MKKLFALIPIMFACTFCLAQNISDTLHVAHYDLHLNVLDFANRTIDGYADLTVVTKVPTLSQYVLDLQSLTVDSVLVGTQPVTFSQDGYKVFVNHNSSQNDTAVVRIYYRGTPISDTRWGGFYFSGQYCYNMGVAFDYQPHNFGRCWFPCLDVFTDKSSYTMHIRTENGKMAVCGGELTDSLTLADSTRVWTWQLDEPIPTYLASMAVGPYVLYADTFQGMERTIPINIYAQPNTINKVSGSFVHLKEILRMYEQLFGPYRWSRVGYVAVNFSSGAMEHATNIAYPNAAITGTVANQSLYAHELFHHWFGDLITCNRAEEMWINEGFATYSEALVDGLMGGEDAYKEHIREVHRATLKGIVKDDGGHYALDNVPQEVTYGTHSYDKGSLIVHSLRSYMGDSLFFGGIKSLLNHFAYQNVSSEEMFEYLAQETGLPLHDFYEGWVHNPGFLHFSIDSIVPLQNNDYRVHLHQKLLGGTHFANSNKVDLTFVAPNHELVTVENAMFSGEFGTVDVTLPFVPAFGIVDYYEKLTDATIDYTQMMAPGTNLSCSDANCSVRLESFPDSVFVRVEHNLVSADMPQQLPDGIYRVSDNHYWNVLMAYDNAVNTIPQGYLQFRFQSGTPSNLDYELMAGYNQDNLKLLYRPTASAPWVIVPVTRSGSPVAGYLKTENLMPGQYCLAVGDPTASVTEYSSNVSLHIYPNPVADKLNVWLDGVGGNAQAVLYDTTGRKVKTLKLKLGDNSVNVSNLKAGVYYLGVKETKGRVIVKSFVKE